MSVTLMFIKTHSGLFFLLEEEEDILSHLIFTGSQRQRTFLCLLVRYDLYPYFKKLLYFMNVLV